MSHSEKESNRSISHFIKKINVASACNEVFCHSLLFCVNFLLKQTILHKTIIHGPSQCLPLVHDEILISDGISCLEE